MGTIREPAVAGMFYPLSEKKLRDEIKVLFDLTKSKDVLNNVVGCGMKLKSCLI